MKNSETITLLSGNERKAAEFERLLGFKINHQNIDLPEIQSIDVKEVSLAKISIAYATLKVPVFVDDTGLSINAWNGLPGALIKWFLDAVGNDGLIRMLANETDRSAKVITSIGYKDEEQEFVVTGELTGTIASEPRGDNGFGYDAIFIPEGYDRTFAEMSDAEKDSISMRAIAAEALRSKLAST